MYIITKNNIEVVNDVYHYTRLIKHYINNNIKFKCVERLKNSSKLLDIKKDLSHPAKDR